MTARWGEGGGCNVQLYLAHPHIWCKPIIQWTFTSPSKIERIPPYALTESMYTQMYICLYIKIALYKKEKKLEKDKLPTIQKM